jgi:pyruvoyl-dependent arginine decarboxylase (PvlArgDC)
MAMETAQLDRLQRSYKAAVEAWIAAIRREEGLASENHSEAEVDAWEAAGFAEEDAREQAKAAKKEYEDALREEFFGF